MSSQQPPSSESAQSANPPVSNAVPSDDAVSLRPLDQNLQVPAQTARTTSPQRTSTRRSGPQHKAPATNNARSPSRSSTAALSGNPTPSAAAVKRAMASTPADLQQKLRASAVDPQASQQLQQQPSSSLKSSPPSGGSSRRESGASDTSHETQKPVHHEPPTPSKLPRVLSNVSTKLETVDEGDVSSPSSPSHDSSLSTSRPPSPSDQKKESPPSKPAQSGNSTKLAAVAEDEDSPTPSHAAATAVRQEMSRNSTAPAALPKAKTSHTNLVPSKMRAGAVDPCGQGMTVETETVASIPQTTTATPAKQPSEAGRPDGGANVKLRTSNETIRPKKEKKKIKRPPSIINSTGPASKADRFEAKVASEIEGDDSDSDETFVYESNPAERRPRQSRNHSRTPSATSVHSISERRSNTRTGSLLDSHRVRGKRSMKFASSSYAPSNADDELSHHDASSQTPGRRQTQHFGIFGSSNKQEHESPFSAASKLRINTRTDDSSPSRRHHHSHTPRSGQRTPTHSVRGGDYRKDEAFDLDHTDINSEQLPLLGGGSLRAPRTRSSRRPVSSALRQMDYYDDPRRGCLARLAGGMVMFVMAILVLMGVAGFFFATTKPMYDVHLQKIQNVLASKQELMLDLKVEAVNPNLGGIAVSNVEINIFAKSQHLRDPKHHNHTKDAQGRLLRRRNRPQRIVIRDDDPSDPPPDDGDDDDDDGDEPDADTKTLFLGRIMHLDSALVFEGSPLRHQAHNATGELQLEKPGSKTDDGGRERWEQVLEHQFELIVRGVLKYQLPLNSRVLTASIGGGVLVHPEEGVDSSGAMRVEPIPKWFTWHGPQPIVPIDGTLTN